MKRALRIFNIAFPFLAVPLLVRLTSPFWNPAGILAIIPIFYYGFVRPRDWFLPVAVLGALALDFQMGLRLFWTISFLALFAAGSLQNWIDLQNQKHGGLYLFMLFFGIAAFALSISGAAAAASVWPAFQAVWLFLWCSLLYIPFQEFAKRFAR
jgi:hypothetical protein